MTRMAKPSGDVLGQRRLLVLQCHLPTYSSSELGPNGLLTPLATRILTWVWDFKPWGYQKHPLPGIGSSVEAILRAVRREDICHCEDEAQQPGHQDGQDDLTQSKEKALSGQQRWWWSAKHTPSYSLNITPRTHDHQYLQKKHATDLLKAYSLNGITFRESSFMQVKLIEP